MNYVLEHFDAEIDKFDAHIHLPWVLNRCDFNDCNLKTYGVSVSPKEYASSNCLALGLHPWYAEVSDLELFSKYCKQTKYIGEVGVDNKYGAEDNREIFEEACLCIASGSFISLHTIRAAREMIEVLKKTGRADDCCLIVHWYSDDADSLSVLRKMGCYFSINPDMLKTKKGREYIKAIDMDHLLIETDLPKSEGERVDVGEVESILSDTYRKICEIKGL